MSSRYIRLAILALVVTATMGGECDPKDSSFFGLIGGGGSLTGTVSGQVTVDGTGRSGVTVTLRDGSTTIATTTTGSNGSFTFENVTTGTRTVVITPATGTTCGTTEQNVAVTGGGTATANFACETAEPETGTVTGTVTVNGSGESGVTVTLRDGTTVIGTTTTGTGGTYSFTNVATGTKNVSIATPDGATCDDDAQDVDVPAGGTATANFACTRPSGNFTVVFTQLVTDHRGNTSVICWITTTTPAQPGGALQVVTTGPGVLTPTINTTLNAGGMAAVESGINLFGTYNIMQTVTSGSNQASSSTTHTVDPSEGTCPVLQSSRYFKRDVVALLPADVRPLGLRPVAFRYREPWGNPAEPQIGLIAEEVVEIFPEAVFLDGRGRPQAIDYDVLAAEVAQAMVARGGRAIRAAIAGFAGDR